MRRAATGKVLAPPLCDRIRDVRDLHSEDERQARGPDLFLIGLAHHPLADGQGGEHDRGDLLIIPRNPSRQLGRAGFHARSRVAFAFDAPRMSVSILQLA